MLQGSNVPLNWDAFYWKQRGIRAKHPTFIKYCSDPVSDARRNVSEDTEAVSNLNWWPGRTYWRQTWLIISVPIFFLLGNIFILHIHTILKIQDKETECLNLYLILNDSVYEALRFRIISCQATIVVSLHKTLTTTWPMHALLNMLKSLLPLESYTEPLVLVRKKGGIAVSLYGN